MAKRTRQALKKLPVEAVEAREGEEIRGGSPKKSSGKVEKYMEFKLKEVLVSGYSID